VSAWSAAPGALDGRGSLLVLGAAPEEPPPGPGARPGPSSAAPARSRDLAHYGRFQDAGGALLVLGAAEDELAFLRGLGLQLGALAAAEHETAGPLELAAGEELDLAAEAHFTGAPADARVLVRDMEGEPVALVLPAGVGRVALVTLDAGAFSNADLADDAAPALLFVRLLEELAPLERVLFDEYALGGWQPATVPALAFSRRFAWLSVHVLLLVLVLGWTSAYSGPFPRDPEPLLAASPLARAVGLARTLERAEGHDLLARLLRNGVLERWCGRVGVRPAEVRPRAAGGRRAARDPEALDACLRALARGDAALHARLAAAFGGPAVTDAQGLARVAARLDALEDELFPEGPPDRKARAGRKTRVAVGAARSGSGTSSRS
jgi:hypothetical protein